jgi:hypothetical protein
VLLPSSSSLPPAANHVEPSVATDDIQAFEAFETVPGRQSKPSAENHAAASEGSSCVLEPTATQPAGPLATSMTPASGRPPFSQRAPIGGSSVGATVLGTIEGRAGGEPDGAAVPGGEVETPGLAVGVGLHAADASAMTNVRQWLDLDSIAPFPRGQTTS